MTLAQLLSVRSLFGPTLSLDHFHLGNGRKEGMHRDLFRVFSRFLLELTLGTCSQLHLRVDIPAASLILEPTKIRVVIENGDRFRRLTLVLPWL